MGEQVDLKDHAWLWHMSTLPESLLSRREAAVVDVLRRAGPVGRTPTQVMYAIVAGATKASRFLSVPESDLMTIRAATAYAVLSGLEDKGFARVVGNEPGEGRSARRYVLTRSGGLAATLAAVVGDRLTEVNEALAVERGRAGPDLLASLAAAGCEHACITSDVDDYRVERVEAGRYVNVCEGTVVRHRELLSWLRLQAGLGTGEAGEGAFAHRPEGDPSAWRDITVRIVPEVVGTRTHLTLREVQATA